MIEFLDIYETLLFLDLKKEYFVAQLFIKFIPIKEHTSFLLYLTDIFDDIGI